jgi:RES domain-containing protein
MLVYRIALAKYSGKLIASGRAARWNPNDVEVIYTASSRSLACLENLVHRNQIGLTMAFNIMTIKIPDNISITHIKITDLPPDWQNFNQMHLTQSIGEKWIIEKKSAILAVPSSIIDEELNYLINPGHDDFKKIKLVKTMPFAFDQRIKQ